MFSPDTTVRRFYQLAIAPELAGELHSESRELYDQSINKFERYFAEWMIENKEPERVPLLRDFSSGPGALKFAMAREVEGGNSPATANKLYRYIKRIWNAAAASEDEGGPLLVTRICRIKPLKEVKRHLRSWHPEEIESIIFAAFTMPGVIPGTDVPANEFWPAQLLTNMSDGVRINAHMRLPTRCWDAERAQIMVPAEIQKQREDQVFDLYPSAQAALVRLAPHERGLPTLFGDWPFDPDRKWRVLRKHLRKLLVAAGLFAKAKDVTRWDLFHKFRRTVATEIAIERGIAAAQEFLGHSTPRITKGYVDKSQLKRLRMIDVRTDPGAAAMQLKLFREGA